MTNEASQHDSFVSVSVNNNAFNIDKVTKFDLNGANVDKAAKLNNIYFIVDDNSDCVWVCWVGKFIDLIVLDLSINNSGG